MSNAERLRELGQLIQWEWVKKRLIMEYAGNGFVKFSFTIPMRPADFLGSAIEQQIEREEGGDDEGSGDRTLA